MSPQKTKILCGRIIGILDDGFVLQNDSGRFDIVYNEKVNIGDIVSLKVEKQKLFIEGKEQVVYRGFDLQVLTSCRDEFFIGRASPNYKKVVVDLNLKEKFVQRSRIMQKIREFFVKRGFLDVETPLLVKLPGMEPYLDVFKTEFVGLPGPQPDRPGTAEAERQDMYLITSPEYALKKLLVAGFEKIFQLGKCFRNKETAGDRHNPEFTMIEWYRAYADYTATMEDTEELVYELVKFVKGGDELRITNHESGATGAEISIDVRLPWTRLKVKDAFKKYAGVDYPDFENTERLRNIAQKKGYKVNPQTSYDDLFFLIFMNEIEPKLGFDKPVILYEYPVSMASLSKKCGHDPRYSERFEAYIAGMELCNAFSDLTDPDEQLARLQAERKERQKLGKEDYPVDQSFIRALQFGMPPCSGNALGVDRLIMLLTDSQSIEDVLFFPFKDLSL